MSLLVGLSLEGDIRHIYSEAMIGDSSSDGQHSITEASTGGDVTASPPSGPQNPIDSPNYVQKIRIRLKSHPVTNRVYRVTVGVVGSLVVILGFFLVPLPGPGWVIVIVGLLILSTEFEKADRLLGFVRAKVDAWADWIKGQSLAVRFAVGLGTAAFVGAVLYVTALLIGVPDWVPGWVVPPLPGLDAYTSR